MNILSIDVGIKNLALCLIHLDENNNFEITKWDVINLCKEEKQTCNCGKNACYMFNNKYYCKKHVNNSNKPVLCKELEENKLKKIKIKELKELLKKENIPFPEDNSKPLIIDYLNTYLSSHFLMPFNNTIKTNDLSLIEIGINMKNLLDELYHNIKIDEVIIENQISPIANRMKTLQGMIAQYFIMNNKTKIDFISAANKLKGHVDLFETDISTYNARKKESINVMNTILNEMRDTDKYNEKWINHFKNHKKKDDLADAYLQGNWYLKHKKCMGV